MDHCNPYNPWIGDDFTPCFRKQYIDAYLPYAIMACSAIMALIGVFRWRRRCVMSKYAPLKSQPSVMPSYGTVPDVADDHSSSSSSTLTPEAESQMVTSRWSVYNLARVALAVAQIVLYVQMGLAKLSDTTDPYLFGIVTSSLVFWGYSLILALANVSSRYKSLADMLCHHLNGLYVCSFIIALIDVRSNYLLGGLENIGLEYRLALVSFSLTSLMLVLVINEERHAPEKPIITETGRIMSGEKWASIYSQFMFTWTNAMMKEGSKRTLNDQDLLELPAENRAKDTLMTYRSHRTKSMALSIFWTFRRALTYQFFYCMVWSVVMFGPPYYLNKIIKFIEQKDTAQVPLSSAYLYVFGLFVTSSLQSLAYQQALYIGRTLGIRIQSIVVGEVFSKSLRRRDESGAAASKTDDDDKETEGNVNNLLSVDAQKMGELTAYIFYVYCFPLQIVICIWSLYQLLGKASIYGVVVMLILQPVTYFLSRRFQKSHQYVMKCTDKRIKLMNELLAAIRIVKFFAWENQFRQRVVAARDVELKAIRSRLYMFMWMGNAWFLIPILIMVTVFYVYTRELVLTASTAFTALALFNTFKSALDELPIIISYVLQARVSLGRVEKFLAEDEVDLSMQQPTTNTHIGFINNASFSWDKPSANSSEPVKLALKNLNISFPRSKLSIVCGPTGAGKTTLLASLLGETYCVSGAAVLPRHPVTSRSPLGGAVSGIAYVAQTAWLQNCSIRDNILFGLPFDEERYHKILYMTALTRDLEILEYGDSTEVGEKGITLSGGQKQRVAIARAVYSQAETIILDDCLSAVDAHTAKHLYENCLTGELMQNRTIILVTHHVGLCMKGADYVVALQEDGTVASCGTPQQVIKSGVLGDEIVQSDEDHKNMKEEAAVEGPIPVVPKTIDRSHKDGAGKLTKDEQRAEGGVSAAVYATYYRASGGFIFWMAVLLFFCLAQAFTVGQDYWIKIWTAAYDQTSNMMGAFSTTRFGSMDTAAFSVAYVNPATSTSWTAKISSVDDAYYLGVYFLIGMVALVMTTLRSLILFVGSLRASKRIHSQLLDQILHAKVRFFDTTPVGRIVNRFSSDLETIDQAIAPSLSLLVYSIIATVFVVALVSVITPAFLVPGILIGALYWSIGSYYLRTSRDLKRLNSVSRSPIYVQFNESINGVSTIRAFGSQFRFMEENFKKIDGNNRPFIWMWATNRWLHCRVDVLGAFVGFCTGVVLLAARQWIQPGLAGLSLSYALTFTQHVLWVVRMYAVNEMNMNAIERVHEYLDIDQEPPAHIPERCPPPSWPHSGAVKVENLVMQYAPENPPVLRNISFETRPREKIGIVGRTGSGKSTLALSLFRFMEATEGRIVIDGVDIHSIGLEDLRSRLTIIPQDPVLFSGTLRSNLDPFGQHDDAELNAALKRAHLMDDGSSISLDAVVTENGNNWSQGQRQLIALARALVKKSALIVLDEATSSVDFDTDHRIQQTIRQEFVDSSLLCIAHRIRTVADYDRILVLDHGKVVEFDTPYCLMTTEGSVFQQMCERSGEYSDLLAIAKAKHEQDQH
ncbi:P-loop containing nucleoside triphosphate hydrolase protein [Radiomyces spectabilis]|uniref:P-loop containing nucleoside triphosphate hydrolase protein n=1 Tax=Radiomyces spectabilis TaxID=64574 RepID=UPI0022202787|nr:P-loop containing nucleoside triphosphate hydrolase protein [Radiomyces spectabilis]KAI8381242.1 P-loop containing nucleoside triphosphate hydrolase protein [Radiomyces spectabilis]